MDSTSPSQSTAVLKISKNFDDKFDINKKRKLNHNISEINEKSKYQLFAEISFLKSCKVELELKINILEKKLKEIEINNEKIISDLKLQIMIEKEKAEVQKLELFKVTKTLKTVYEEKKNLVLTNHDSKKLSFEFNFNEKNGLQNENTEKKLKKEKNVDRDNLEEKISKLQKDLMKSSQFEPLVENLKYQLKIETQKIKDLELELSRCKEVQKYSREFFSLKKKVPLLEQENRRLQNEINFFRSERENTDLIAEELEGMKKKIEKFEMKITKLGELEDENEYLNKKLSAFLEIMKKFPNLRGPGDVVSFISDLNQKNLLYVNSNSSLNSKLKSLEKECELLRSELSKPSSSSDIDSEDLVKNRNLEKKLFITSKERDLYKNLLESYGSGESREVSCLYGDELKKLQEEKLKNMEQILTQTQTKNDFFKQKIFKLEEEMEEIKESKIDISSNNITSLLYKQIQDLEKKLHFYIKKNEELHLASEKAHTMGFFDISKTKVVHLPLNPHSCKQKDLTKELLLVKEENQILKIKLKSFLENKQLDDLTVRTNNAIASLCSVKDQDELKKQLSSVELLNKRFTENFEKISERFKLIVKHLLGFKIEMVPGDKIKVSSFYSHEPNDFFLFQQSVENCFILLENNYSDSFKDLAQTYLKLPDALPAFMGAANVHLFKSSLSSQ